MIKFCFLCAVLALPLGIAAQTGQPVNVALLPDAPLPQSLLYSTSVEGGAELGQTPSVPAPADAATPDTAAKQQQGSSADDIEARRKREIADQEKQRLLGIMPEFNLVSSGEAAPIGPKEKFSLFFHSAFDPFQFVLAGIDAGIEQAENTYPEWHQGFAGFAKRYAASYGDSFDGNLWGNAILPSVLHQDPRYYRIGHGTFKHRVIYMALSTVRCKGDNGKWQPNISNVAGNIIGGAVSNLYYPASQRGVGLTFERGLTVTAEGTFGAFLEEFYPDYVKWRQHRRERKAAAVSVAKP